MRILIITNTYPSPQKKYSGIFVKNQYEELKKLLPSDDVLHIFYMKRQLTSRLGSITKYLKTFIKFIPKLFKNYDIIHLHFFHPLIYVVWLYKKLHPKCKVIVTFHGSDINEKVNYKNQNHFRKIAKCIDFTIPVGKELAYEVNSKLGLETGKVLSAGVDSKIFYKIDNPIIKQYDYIFVGSFLPVKGIDLLLKVIEILPKNFSYCIVGKGQLYINAINKLIDMGYNIILKIDQSQDELRLLYNKSKFLVQPSREEGFGLVVAEGMFCGLPAVVSNVGGFKDQVVHGKNGFLFEKENIEKMYELMLTLKELDDCNYNLLSKEAINCSRELSLRNICHELITIYEKILDGSE